MKLKKELINDYKIYYYDSAFRDCLEKIIKKEFVIEEVLKNSPKVYIFKILIDGHIFLLKELHSLPFTKKILSFFRTNHSLNSLINITKVIKKGFPEIREIYGAGVLKNKFGYLLNNLCFVNILMECLLI